MKPSIFGIALCGISIVAAPGDAGAEPGAPRSLTMRPAAATSPPHARKRVGQAPAPDPADDPGAPDEPDDPGALDGASPDELDAGDIAAPGAVQPGAPARPVERPAALADRRAAPTLFTVTGSLIERATRTTPSPLTILDRGDLLAAGRTMIGDVLQPLPEQGNALNAQFNNGGDGSTRINLRTLGIARTLTLLNGRRFVPAGPGADTSVDLNTIPLAVIDRVEVLKDGASPVYGSDAVAGVVNIITRDDFQGTEASLYTGQSERNDGFTYDASFITGHRLADGNGHIVFSAGTQRQDPVSAADREFSKVFRRFDFNRGVATPSGSAATPGGRIDATQIDINGDGIGDEVNVCGFGVAICTADGRGGFRPFNDPADLYNFQTLNLIYTPSSRASAYTSGSYRLAPGVKGFFEASFLHRESLQQLAPEPLVLDNFALKISRDSVFNPFGGDVLSYFRRLDELGVRRFRQNVDTLRTVVGMRGEGPTPDSWKWELSYNYGRSDATQVQTGHVVLSRVASALGPSFLGPGGVPTCGTPFAPIFGCVPMNLLPGSGSISEAARKYISFTGVDIGSDQQQMALATAHGRIVKLPGNGDISLAVSADARRDTGDFTPDSLIASGDTTANVQPGIHGSIQAVEAAAELSIVPLRDRDGVERLEIDLAARSFRYDTFGSGTTSSVRALIRPVDGITLRASRSSSFRAPSVAETFTEQQDGFLVLPDPCDHAFGVRKAGSPASPVSDECAREGVPPDAVFGTIQQRGIFGGNPNVRPETAEISSAGVVLESARAPGLSLSVDFWNIDVTQAIQQPDPGFVLFGCYDQGNRALCDLVHRDPARGFAIDFIDLRSTNLGGTSTSGVDTAVNLDHATPGQGALHARVDVQMLNTFDLDTGAEKRNGVGVYDLGVHPKRKAQVQAAWRHPRGASMGFNFLFVDSFQECRFNDCANNSAQARTVESYEKLDVFGTVVFGHRTPMTTLTIGVNNVFDRAPPTIFAGAAGNYDEATYDFLGRFAYARLTQTF
ncbi:MAG TPA: TonB-dependent receptor [Kofleriaceae bacterium]|nr:TonB-dependent receptor [Kofleriaceae bacterium]